MSFTWFRGLRVFNGQLSIKDQKPHRKNFISLEFHGIAYICDYLHDSGTILRRAKCNFENRPFDAVGKQNTLLEQPV